MFTFSESDYVWCPECSGSIRKGAYYCRYCRQAIGNKMYKDLKPHPNCTFDDVSQWLPSFTSLMTKCSDGLQERLKQADAAVAARGSTIGVPEGMTPEECSEDYRNHDTAQAEPPEPHINGLLMDILLSLLEQGESIAEICAHPRLQLLEMTPQDVLAESELRKSEMERNHKCEYCAEYTFPEDDECRFCGGSAERKPAKVDSFSNKPIDSFLLKAVIVYEAARGIVCGGEPIAVEILAANAVTPEQIEQEILRQRTSDARLPMNRYCKRMVELGLHCDWSPESMTVSSLVDLGSALDTRKNGRADEALIVYTHALNRIEGIEELTQERGRVYQYLSLLYQGKEDYEKYKEYHDLAQECQSYGMPEEFKELMRASDINSALLLQNLGVEEDPEKRLASLDASFSESDEMIAKFAEQLDGAVPGLGGVIAAVSDDLISGQMRTMRAAIEIEIAKNNGDYDLAESKLIEAIELLGDSWIHGAERPKMLCALAEIKHLQGDDTAADSRYHEAMRSADEYFEAKPAFARSAIWRSFQAYACFLRDTARNAESETYFKRAAAVLMEEIVEATAAYGERDEYNGAWAYLKGEHAKLLRALHRDEEASEMEESAQQHQKLADERDARVQTHKAKIAEQLGVNPDRFKKE